MAFETSRSNASAPQAAGKSTKAVNGKIMALTFVHGDKEKGTEEKMRVLLHERVSAKGGTYFMGNPATKLEDGTWENQPEVYYFMPRKTGGIVRLQEVKGGPITDVSELRTSERKEGTFYGFIRGDDGDTRVYLDPYIRKADRQETT
jgi:hypothetical protein